MAPAAWSRAFDFVLEIFTIQALPIAMRQTTIATIADFVAPGGNLCVFTRGKLVIDSDRFCAMM